MYFFYQIYEIEFLVCLVFFATLFDSCFLVDRYVWSCECLIELLQCLCKIQLLRYVFCFLISFFKIIIIFYIEYYCIYSVCENDIFLNNCLVAWKFLFIFSWLRFIVVVIIFVRYIFVFCRYCVIKWEKIDFYNNVE